MFQRPAPSASLVELATGSGSLSPWSWSPSPTAGSAPSSLATTSTTDRTLQACAAQLRCFSRPTTYDPAAPCSRRIPPRENGLKLPESGSAQSVIAATWRDLLTIC
jgi:hypothetical protein